MSSDPLQAIMYRPGIGGALLNPFYIARAGLWHALGRHAPLVTGRVLDIGCGTKPYRGLFHVDAYIGVDVELRGHPDDGCTDLVYDGASLPFADDCFDGVVCSQVMEHVRDPDATMAEICRVLRRRGVLLVTVPFVWDEHEQPEDYRRFTSFGLRQLALRHGLTIEVMERVSPDLGVIFQLFNNWLFRVTSDLPRWLRVPLRPLMCAPVTLLGLVAARLLPDNPDMYLDHLLVARK